MNRRDWLWRPNLIVFISNACIMIVELVAGRLIAPFVGVSLYTWTSVIGVILAGISLGNYVGGKIADRFASRRALGLIFIVAGLASLSILLTTRYVGEMGTPVTWPLILRILLFTGAIFLLPSAILGAISPLVIKLTLQDLSKTGNVVGKIYASSAVGSILGTFATGFFLIAWFGTRTIVLAVGLVLIAMGALLGDWGRRPQPALLLATALLAGSSVFAQAEGLLISTCLHETNYFCIKVREQITADGSSVQVLILDRLVHSYTSLTDPTKLEYGYEKVYAEIARYVARRHRPLRAMFIGGGGYTFPKYLEAVYPGSQLEVAEIDPGVTQTAHERLGLPLDTSIRTANVDARLFLANLDPAKRYDLVLGDAFNDYSIPYHLTTREFNDLVAAHLSVDGLYAVNLIDGRHTEFLRAYLRTARLTFAHVYLVPVGTTWETDVRTTFVIVMSQRALDLPEFDTIEGIGGFQRFKAWLVPEEQVDALLARDPQVVLTDDYVPVDQFLATVFEESEAGR